MADKVLIWSTEKCGNAKTLLPAYYMEAEYEPVAVRIYAETAPSKEDVSFEIYDDGVSIMSDYYFNYNTYIADTQGYSGTYSIELPTGANTDDMAEDLNGKPIDVGSWVTCEILAGGGAKNITIQLELNKISEDDED